MSEYREFAGDWNPDGTRRLNTNAIAAFIRRFRGKPFVVRISEPIRGSRHNKKLHAVLGEVADALGWEADEYKEFIVTKLRPLGEDRLTGFMRRQRTHKMTDEEIDQLIAEIKAWTFHEMPGFRFKELAA